MRKPKLIIFDLDGVIADTSKLHFAAWLEISTELGLAFDEDMNQALKGVSRMESLNIILENNSKILAYNGDEKERLLDKKNNMYKGLINGLNPIHILPGIHELIADIEANNMKMAIASSSKNAKAILEKLQLTEKFHYIADAGKIKKTKPDAEIFVNCAKALNTKIEDCVGIEDSLAGVQAMAACSMFSVGIGIQYEEPTKGEQVLRADYEIETTGALKLATIIERYETENAEKDTDD